MGATLSTLLRAVHPGTIAMTDFRRRLTPHTYRAPEQEPWLVNTVMIHSSWSLVSLLQANCPPILCCASPFNMSERVTIMRVGAATYGVGGVKERGMEVEREGGGQYQALPKGMFPTTVKVNVHREASLDV